VSDPEIPLFRVLMSPSAKDAVADVLASGQIAQGPVVDHFEAALAVQLGVPADLVVTVNSGTSALHLAYDIANIGYGSSVSVSPMTCAATITPLVHRGAQLRWVDVDPVSGNVDQVKESESCDALVVVDWAGRPVALKKLRETVGREIPIVEDAAHAMFARDEDGISIAQRAVADGRTFVAFSLQAIKHLTAGDGGILICPTAETADRARRLRWFGFDRKSSADFRCAQDLREAGYKYHLNDIAAAIGLANIPIACEAVTRHRRNASRYHHELGDLGRVQVPPWHAGSAWWIYTLIVEDRADFTDYMKARGIQTSQVHRRNDEHSAFRGAIKPSLPGLDAFSARQVSIPVGWWLSDRDVVRVIEGVTSWSRS